MTCSQKTFVVRKLTTTAGVPSKRICTGTVNVDNVPDDFPVHLKILIDPDQYANFVDRDPNRSFSGVLARS